MYTKTEFSVPERVTTNKKQEQHDLAQEHKTNQTHEPDKNVEIKC